MHPEQKWSRGHKARGQGQGHKKNPRPRPRTDLPMTDPLEAKNRNAQGQGQRPGTQRESDLQKKSSKFFFRCSGKKKFFKKLLGDLQNKSVFKNFFQAIYKILTVRKILLSSSRGQGNFRGLEASRPRSSLRTPPLTLRLLQLSL